MKLPCKVIEDLLPMYYDKVCSEESAALIEEHMENCLHCSRIFSDLDSAIDISERNVDDIKPLKKIQKSYKKMRLRWFVAILCVLLLIPIAFLVGNDYREQVEEYSEAEAMTRANTFMTCLTEGDYATAYTHLNIENITYYARQDGVNDEDLVNFEADGLKRFCEIGEELEDLGGIETCEYLDTRASGFAVSGGKEYYIYYRVRIAGRIERLDVTVGENGINHFGLTLARTEHPLSQLCHWDQWVLDKYLGRYYDYDLSDYVYYDKED